MSESREIVHRELVEVAQDAAGLDQALDLHVEARPSGFCTTLRPYGFSFRREPAVFHFVATGTSLGSAILLAEFSTRIPLALTTFATVLSAIFFVAAVSSLFYFLQNAATRLEVVARPDSVEISRKSLFGNQKHTLDADRIVAILVVKNPSGALSLAIAGPRHETLLELHRARLLDPDSLPIWLAKGIALVARKASVRAHRDALAEPPHRKKARGWPGRRLSPRRVSSGRTPRSIHFTKSPPKKKARKARGRGGGV